MCRIAELNYRLTSTSCSGAVVWMRNVSVSLYANRDSKVFQRIENLPGTEGVLFAPREMQARVGTSAKSDCFPVCGDAFIFLHVGRYPARASESKVVASVPPQRWYSAV